MEALLSLAFDNLSSYDGSKIRKGLRQIEGLLAQLCLSSPGGAISTPSSSPTKQRSKLSNEINDGTGESDGVKRKSLAELSDDPAFLEFFKLQEGFEWNVSVRLVNSLDRLIAKGGDGQNDLVILSALDLMQGLLLLHPPSKGLFSREQNMNLLLDLLEPTNCPAIQSATLLTLVTALLDCPHNARTFEALDGLLTITSLFRSRSTSREVKLRLVEFLYFYLMPETPSIPWHNARESVPAMLQRSPSKLVGAFGADKKAVAEGGKRPRANSSEGTRSTEEKQALLGHHLSSVEDLVKDLKTCTPFGGVVC